MDKLSTLFLVLVAWLFSGTAYADDTDTGTSTTTTPSLSFSPKDGVLTVNAVGDMTTYKGTIKSTKRVFTQAAEGKIVRRDANSWSYVNVVENEAFNSSSKYAYVTNSWAACAEGAPVNDYRNINNVKEIFSIPEGKYIYEAYLDNDKIKINSQAVTETYSPNWYGTIKYNDVTYSNYVVCSEAHNQGDLLDPATEGLLHTVADMKENYVVTQYEVISDFVYKSTDGGKNKTHVAKGTYTYVKGESFYTMTDIKNNEISDNSTYFAENGEGASYVISKEITAELTFLDAVKDQLASTGCKTLKFALSGTPATLSKDQVQGIINSANSAEYCFDFSNIQGLTEEELSGLTYTGTTTPAWVVPDYSKNGTKISTEKKKSIAEAYQKATKKANNDAANNVYWFSPNMQNDMTEAGIAKYNLNVLSNGNGTSAAYGSKLPEADTKNVVVYLQGVALHARAMNATDAIKFDYPGISNLVLDNITLWGGDSLPAFESCRNAMRVILQGKDVSTWTKKGTSQSSVKIVQSVCTPNGSNSTDTVCQIKVLEPGALNKLSQAHYIDQAITDAFSSDIYGEINTEDFTFLNGSNMKRLNLANATYTGAADDLLTFNNDYLLYLALPTKDASSKTDPDFYNKFNGLFKKCKNLKGLSYYDSVEKQLTATLRDLRDEKGEIRDIKYANGNSESGVAMGTLKTLTDMETKQTDENKNIKAVRLAGRMCAQDLGSDIQYDTAGHLVYKITRTAKQGDDENLTDTLYQKELIPITSHTVGEDELTKELTKKLDMTRVGALNYALSIETADLENVSIDEKFQNDLCLGALGKTYGQLKTVTWPTDKSVQEIPTSCFTGNHNITEICIPANVKKIGGSAFQDVHNLIRVTTTGPSKYWEGNVEKVVPAGTYDHGDSTATFSANLKMIETGAFSLVENFKDVYCLGKDAPQCQRWAFDTNLTFGNNGFTRTDDGLITRENFYKGGATDPTDPTKKAPKQWIAVLHFPSGCSSDQIKKYTDPTREYSIADGKGTTDGNGHLLMWPKHTEMVMSYAQGHTGYTWKAWNAKRNEKQGNEFFELELSDAIYHDPLHPTQTMGNAEYANAIKEGKVSDGDYRFYVPSETKEDYQGWHEFILTGSYHYSDPEPTWNFDKISDNGWWTICLPFDMTKAQMAQVFGTKNPDGSVKEYPVLCRLVSVKRDGTKQQITLNFGKDLVQYKDETNNESKEATDSASVVLLKGHPYMLKPNMPIDKNGKVTIPRDFPFTKLNFVPPTDGVDNIIAKNEAIINDVSPVVQAVNEKGEKVDWYYRFIGTFTKWYVPENCYFFAWYGKESQPRWFYKNYIDRQKRFWNPNTCVIMVNKTNYVPKFMGYDEGLQATSHWDIFDKAYVSYFDWDGYTPKPAVNNAQSNKPTGNAKVAPSLYGFEGASGIVNQIKFNFKQADPSSAAPVYNLNGQMVSPDGDTSRLVKGIYIKNGRKFVVK